MGILQARMLEWVAMPFFRDPPNPGIKFRSPSLQADYLLSAPLGKPICNTISIQLLSRVQLFATAWTAALQASCLQLSEFTQTHVHWIGNAIQSSHPLSSPSPSPSIFPSIRVFSKESPLRIRWPKYWSFSFSISPSNEHSGLISLRMGWLDLLVVQGTLKSLLQHHSSKASILRLSGFFIVQLSHPYMTTGKTIALARQTFVGKVMSLLFNMLSRLAKTFLPRSKHLLNFMAAVTICSDCGAPQNKVSHYFHCFFIYLPWRDGTEYWALRQLFHFPFSFHQESL